MDMSFSFSNIILIFESICMALTTWTKRHKPVCCHIVFLLASLPNRWSSILHLQIQRCRVILMHMFLLAELNLKSLSWYVWKCLGKDHFKPWTIHIICLTPLNKISAQFSAPNYFNFSNLPQCFFCIPLHTGSVLSSNFVGCQIL